MTWAAAFATTLVVETPLYVAGLRRTLGSARAVGLALGLNVLTHPLAFALGSPGSPVRFVVVESAVWLVEALLLWTVGRLPPSRAAVLSLAANALSAGAGLLMP